MRSFCFILFLAAVSLPAFVSAHYDESVEDTESATMAMTTTPKPLCKESPCTRLYMPVCSLVDGVQITAPSPCVLKNKIRCAAVLREKLGKSVPKVRLLHYGPCSQERDRSNIVRMRRNVTDEGKGINKNSSKDAKSDKKSHSAKIITDMDDSEESEESNSGHMIDDISGSDESDEKSLPDDMTADISGSDESDEKNLPVHMTDDSSGSDESDEKNLPVDMKDDISESDESDEKNLPVHMTDDSSESNESDEKNLPVDMKDDISESDESDEKNLPVDMKDDISGSDESDGEGDSDELIADMKESDEGDGSNDEESGEDVEDGYRSEGGKHVQSKYHINIIRIQEKK